MVINRWFVPIILLFFLGGAIQYIGLISQTQTNYIVIAGAFAAMTLGHGRKFLVESGRQWIVYILAIYVIIHGVILDTSLINTITYLYYLLCVFIGLTAGRIYAEHLTAHGQWVIRVRKAILLFFTIEAFITTVQKVFAEPFAAHSHGKFSMIDAVFGTFYLQSDASLAAVTMMLIIALYLVEKRKTYVWINGFLASIIIMNGESKQAHVTFFCVLAFLLCDALPSPSRRIRRVLISALVLLSCCALFIYQEQVLHSLLLLRDGFISDFYTKEYDGTMPRFAPLGQILIGDNIIFGNGALTYYNPLTKDWIYNSGFSTIYELWIDFGLIGFVGFFLYLIYKIPSFGGRPWLWMALFLCVFDYCAVNFALSDLAFLSVFGFICGIGCRLEIKGRKMLRSRDASVSIIARRNPSVGL